MKFNTLLENITNGNLIAESSGLSQTGMDKKAIKAFHKFFKPNKKMPSLVRNDMNFETLANKNDAKFKLNSGEVGTMIVSIDKNGNHTIIRQLGNGRDNYNVYKYNSSTDKVDEINSVTAPKAVSMLDNKSVIYHSSNANIDKSVENARVSANNARTYLNGKDAIKFRKAFGPVFGDMAEAIMDDLKTEIITNPFSDKSTKTDLYRTNMTNYALGFARMGNALDNGPEEKSQKAASRLIDTLHGLGIASFDDMLDPTPDNIRDMMSKALKLFKDKNKVYSMIKAGKLRAFDQTYLG